MKKNDLTPIEKYNNARTRRYRYLRVLSVFACIVVFVTTYALIIPAITMDSMLICKLEEHEHNDFCYNSKGVLTCGKEEHVHTAECYDAPPAAMKVTDCDMDEHIHTPDCYYPDGTLKCTIPAHTHTEDCFTPEALEEYKAAHFLATELDDNGLPETVTADPAANEWQVLSGRYTGNIAEDATIIYETDADGEIINHFRLQKNIVPTGEENEFLIYLNVEPVYYHNWREVLYSSGIVLNNSNNQITLTSTDSFNGTWKLGDIKALLGLTGMTYSRLVSDEFVGHMTKKGTYKDFADYTDKPDNIIYISKLVVFEDEEITDFNDKTGQPVGGHAPYDTMEIEDAHLCFSLAQGSQGSFTAVYCAPHENSISVQLSNIWYDGNANGGTLHMPYAVYQALVLENMQYFDHITQRSIPKLVTDPMGDYIEFVGIDYCSTDTDGVSTTSFDNNTNVLTWDLSNYIVEPSKEADDYNQINDLDAFSRDKAFQLTYKVRLKTEKEGFQSCAAETGLIDTLRYETNKATTVSYRLDTDKDTVPDRSANFSVPEVRGLLYDISFKKVDNNGSAVPGATFTLYDSKNNQVGDPIETTQQNIVHSFTSLPVGTYRLVEDFPPNYHGAPEYTIKVCYTDDMADDGALSTLVFTNPDMRYAENDVGGVWGIVNVFCGPPLPATGGKGDKAFYIAGSHFLAFAVLASIFLYKRSRFRA